MVDGKQEVKEEGEKGVEEEAMVERVVHTAERWIEQEKERKNQNKNESNESEEKMKR